MGSAAADLLVRDFDGAGLTSLRHDVARLAAEHGLTDPALYRFVVAVNEVTTNAVRHGGGTGRLRLWRTADRLHCQVSDAGPGMAPAGRQESLAPVHAVSGRGLWLARHACDLATDTGAAGTTVTLSCPAPPAG